MAAHPYPTATHARAADEALVFLRRLSGVDAVLLVNSCARGRALPTSDLDLAVLAASPKEKTRLEEKWADHYRALRVFRDLERLSEFACIHVDFFDGAFRHEPWDSGGGPDSFELEIGNWIAHGRSLFERNERISEIRKAWLPYYSDELRSSRLEMVTAACRMDLVRTRHYVERRLPFQAFENLYKALREFLQGFFIHERVYPLSYTKWLGEQLEPLPGGRSLYERLPGVLQIGELCGREMIAKAELIESLVCERLSGAEWPKGPGSPPDTTSSPVMPPGW